jgi:hypothetical protein
VHITSYPRGPLTRLGAGSDSGLEPSEVYWSACYNTNLWKIRHNPQNTVMPLKLPNLARLVILTAAVLAGSARGQSPPQPGSPAISISGSTLLASSIHALEARPFFFTSVRQQVNVFGYQMMGDGSYYEVRQGPVPLLRLEMRLHIGNQNSSLMQICNGHYLYIYQKLLDDSDPTLRRVDATRVLKVLETRAGGLPAPGTPLLSGLGGLSQLLRGLQTNFDFAPATLCSLAIRGPITSLPVWVLDGRWKPAKLAALLPKQQAAIAQGRAADLSKLPEQLPEKIVVLLGREDLFPRRIDYVREHGTNHPPDGRMLTLEFLDPDLNSPISPDRFVYNPGTAPCPDVTEMYIQSLGAAR